MKAPCATINLLTALLVQLSTPYTLQAQVNSEKQIQETSKPSTYPPKLKVGPLAQQLQKLIDYPDEARKKEIFGMVIARALVNTRGKIDSVAIIAGHQVFHAAVKKGLRKLEFQPSLKDDKTPVPFWFMVPVTFVMKTGPLQDLDTPAELIGPPLHQQLQQMVRYPARAKEAGIEGVVVATAMIDLDGNVAGVQYVDGPVELQSAAVRAITQLKYKPALNTKGNPMIYYQPIPVYFSLKDNNKHQ